MKNLNIFIDDRKLEQIFGAYGKVISARVMRHHNGLSKGFGFVNFSTVEEAKMALDSLNGSLYIIHTLWTMVTRRVLYLSSIKLNLFFARDYCGRNVSPCDCCSVSGRTQKELARLFCTPSPVSLCSQLQCISFSIPCIQLQCPLSFYCCSCITHELKPEKHKSV